MKKAVIAVAEACRSEEKLLVKSLNVAWAVLVLAFFGLLLVVGYTLIGVSKCLGLVFGGPSNRPDGRIQSTDDGWIAAAWIEDEKSNR